MIFSLDIQELSSECSSILCITDPSGPVWISLYALMFIDSKTGAIFYSKVK